MSVLVEAFTLITRRETIDRVYPGGLSGFRLDFPDSFAADDHLVRMGSTDPRDVRVTVDRLQELGIRYASRYEYLEMAVAIPRTGASAACSWLTFSRRDGYSVCWLEGEAEGKLCSPPGWTPERSRAWDEGTVDDPSRFIPVEIATDALGTAELEPMFGGPIHSGVPFEDGAALRALLREGEAANASYIEHGHMKGLADLYRRAASLNPNDAELAFLAGHMLDREDRTVEGLAYVDRALGLDPKYSRALTQKGYVLGRSGNAQEALDLLRRAVEVDPTNSSAWSYKAREERYAKLTDDVIASYERFLELAREQRLQPMLIEEAEEWVEKLRAERGGSP